jgi:hypothetical protein
MQVEKNRGGYFLGGFSTDFQSAQFKRGPLNLPAEASTFGSSANVTAWMPAFLVHLL